MLLYTRRKNSSDSQSTFCIHSAVYILYLVCSLLSTFCNSTFSFFPALIIFFPFVRMQTTYNVSSNPPTLQKITLACITCLCFEIGVYPWPDELTISVYQSDTRSITTLDSKDPVPSRYPSYPAHRVQFDQKHEWQQKNMNGNRGNQLAQFKFPFLSILRCFSITW